HSFSLSVYPHRAATALPHRASPPHPYPHLARQIQPSSSPPAPCADDEAREDRSRHRRIQPRPLVARSSSRRGLPSLHPLTSGGPRRHRSRPPDPRLPWGRTSLPPETSPRLPMPPAPAASLQRRPRRLPTTPAPGGSPHGWTPRRCRRLVACLPGVPPPAPPTTLTSRMCQSIPLKWIMELP
ncbi:hypothetical protein U9M48_001766, partial [Paspalum notatum var. saurae]